jgi:hypothetical protein
MNFSLSSTVLLLIYFYGASDQEVDLLVLADSERTAVNAASAEGGTRKD